MLALASLFGFDWKSPVIEAQKSPSAPQVPESFQRGKRKTIIGVKLKRGLLTQFGYHADKSARARHIALMKAVAHEGYVGVIRHLNLVATYSKNRTPAISRIFRQDQRWLSAKYKKEKERTGQSHIRWGGSSKLTAGQGSTSATRGSSRDMEPEDVDEDYEDEDYDDDEFDKYDEDEEPDVSMSGVGQDDEEPDESMSVDDDEDEDMDGELEDDEE